MFALLIGRCDPDPCSASLPRTRRERSTVPMQSRLDAGASIRGGGCTVLSVKRSTGILPLFQNPSGPIYYPGSQKWVPMSSYPIPQIRVTANSQQSSRRMQRLRFRRSCYPLSIHSPYLPHFCVYTSSSTLRHLITSRRFTYSIWCSAVAEFH